jgi:AraC family transcriptional regulator, transcriptional activator of pobA
LLKNTSMTLDEVSIEIGYTERGTLTRIFKKQEGITPSQYRKIVSV